MINYNSIRSVHLEISSRCNASCPLCPRNVAGFDTDLGFPVHDMSLTEAKAIFPTAFVTQLNNILINGNFGDFVTARDNLDIVKYFVDTNPNIKILISTNGGARPNIWSELGTIPNVRVGFALDGLAGVHELYRRNTRWETVIANAKKFIDAGGYAIWRMIKFDHSASQVDQCKKLSQELGFKEFDLIYDGRDSSPVYDKNGTLSYKIGKNNIGTDYPDNVVEWQSWTNPGSSPDYRKQQYPSIPIKSKLACEAIEKKEIYVTATGEVYPCCWLGMYPLTEHKHAWQLDNHQIKDIAVVNNALTHGIEKSIEWFNSIEQAWTKSSYQDGRLIKCDQYCGQQ